MATKFNYYLPIEQAKGRFYMRKHFSNDFKDITEQRLKEIIKDAQEFRKKQTEQYSKKTTFLREPVSLYSSTMFYLTNPCIDSTYPTFDEKMAFLINVIDPEYIIGRMYIQAPLLTAYEQEELKDTTSDPKLDEHKRVHNVLYRQTENLFGCSDSQLIKFARIYFRRFIQPHELQTNIKANHTKELFDQLAKELEDKIPLIVRIRPKDFESANEIAKKLIVTQPDIKNPNTLAFNILKQNKLLGGNSSYKQAFIIFILAIDPELKMLQIYYDESMIPKVEERCIEEFGFYQPNLIKLESLIQKKFMPDKKVSIWQI